MPSTSALPFLPAVFRKKREPKQPSRSLSAGSSDSIDASIRPYILEGPLITPGGTPGWASQPWHYVFQDGDVAWALGGNGRWRLVRVVGNGFIEEIENRKQVAYNVTWAWDGATIRGTFAPGCGDIKPNTLAIRRLLIDEGLRYVERRDWQVLNEEEDREVGSIQDKSSEKDDQT